MDEWRADVGGVFEDSHEKERGRRGNRAGIGCVTYLTAVVVLLTLPYVLWLMRPPSEWRAVVVDKTVPHASYREHSALFWTLRHFKGGRPDGTSSWDSAHDYIGYYPTPGGGMQPYGRLLSEDDLRGANLLILADTYGVYTGDYSRDRDGQAAHLQNRLIYGALRPEEIEVVERFVAAGGALVAEFNAFASPTEGTARQRLQELLGVRWTGWSGRYFVDLGDSGEVPEWARVAWSEQNEQGWEFEGPGYLLVHEGGRIVVLEEGLDVDPAGLRVGEADRDSPLMRGVRPGVPFRYWFDIVDPVEGTRVLMWYRFELTARGRSRLEEIGIPALFPAVLQAGGSPLRLYFAGDFADNPVDAGPHFVRIWPWMRKYGTALGSRLRPDQTAFFWNVYVPLMGNLLGSSPQRTSGAS